MRKVLIAFVSALISLPVLADVTGVVSPPGGSGGSSLPSQTGNSGKFLTTNGTSASWASPTASASSVTPGTTTVIGATAPCLIDNSATTVMGCLAETGSGNAVLATSPTLVTPNIGAAIGTSLSVTGQLTSTVATGTAPLVVSSTTNVANLNASSLNGATFASPGAIGSTTAGSGAFTTLSASSTVSGAGFSTYLASPPAIGGTAPAAGAFTTLSATGQITSTLATGTAPFSVASTTQVANLNAASVGGYTLPCTVPALVNGEYLTNNGTTCSWASVAGSGTINAAAQYATPYYSAAGSATTLSGLASPTSGAGYYVYRYDPTSATAVAPTLDQVGATARSISGATSTDTALYSDVGSLVIHDKAGSAAVTETLPTPTSLNNTHFFYTYCNDSANTDTITPTTYTIALNGGTAGASISVGAGICAQVSVDPFNASQWDAFSYGASSAGSGTVNSGTSGQLTYYGATGNTVSGAADATISGGTLSLGAAGTVVGSVALANATSGTVTLAPTTGALGTVTATFPANSGTVAELNLGQVFTAANTFSYITDNASAVASASSLTFSTGPYTAGTATTNWPTLYFKQGATAPTTWSTAGTVLGANAPSGFTGNFLDFHVNGGTSVASLSATGALTVASCTGCGAATAFQANGVALTSASTVNFENGSAHDGLTVAVTNPSAGNVSYALTGNYLPSVSTATSATSVTPDCTFDFVKVTASATGTFTVNAPGTCTPVDGQKLEIKVISPAGGTLTYSWNAAYIASATLALPTTSNAASKEDYFEFQYDSDKAGWVFLADNQGF